MWTPKFQYVLKYGCKLVLTINWGGWNMNVVVWFHPLTKYGSQCFSIRRRNGIHSYSHLNQRQPKWPNITLYWIVCSLQSFWLENNNNSRCQLLKMNDSVLDKLFIIKETKVHIVLNVHTRKLWNRRFAPLNKIHCHDTPIADVHFRVLCET